MISYILVCIFGGKDVLGVKMKVHGDEITALDKIEEKEETKKEEMKEAAKKSPGTAGTYSENTVVSKTIEIDEEKARMTPKLVRTYSLGINYGTTFYLNATPFKFENRVAKVVNYGIEVAATMRICEMMATAVIDSVRVKSMPKYTHITSITPPRINVAAVAAVAIAVTASAAAAAIKAYKADVALQTMGAITPQIEDAKTAHIKPPTQITTDIVLEATSAPTSPFVVKDANVALPLKRTVKAAIPTSNTTDIVLKATSTTTTKFVVKDAKYYEIEDRKNYVALPLKRTVKAAVPTLNTTTSATSTTTTTSTTATAAAAAALSTTAAEDKVTKTLPVVRAAFNQQEYVAKMLANQATIASKYSSKATTKANKKGGKTSPTKAATPQSATMLATSATAPAATLVTPVTTPAVTPAVTPATAPTTAHIAGGVKPKLSRYTSEIDMIRLPAEYSLRAHAVTLRWLHKMGVLPEEADDIFSEDCRWYERRQWKIENAGNAGKMSWERRDNSSRLRFVENAGDY